MDWLVIVAIVLGAVALLYLIFAYVVSRKLYETAVHPVKHTIDEAREFQKRQEGLNFDEYDNVWKKESFSLTTFDKIEIKGEVVINPQPSKVTKVAVIVHGYSWNRITDIKYAKIFYDLGYNLVLFDHRYFGESGGNECTMGCRERHDLCLVIDYARQRFGSDAVLCLHGESMGAATSLLALSLRSDIDFVVADCPFSDTLHYYYELCRHKTHLPGIPIVNFANMRNKRLLGYKYQSVSPLRSVKETNVPICFIHGTSDDFIQPHHSQDLFAVANNENSELHLVEGALHARSYLKDNDGYAKIVGEFVTKMEKLLLNKGEQQ